MYVIIAPVNNPEVRMILYLLQGNYCCLHTWNLQPFSSRQQDNHIGLENNDTNKKECLGEDCPSSVHLEAFKAPSICQYIVRTFLSLISYDLMKMSPREGETVRWASKPQWHSTKKEFAIWELLSLEVFSPILFPFQMFP